ncbi:MAG: hypothetical protein KME10_19255 [Plectolyngbya sp. WJT66-NPBG17]|nr:hypothetical protein [Plectolyngbya sp. WJT66-NPBG17]
MKNYTLSLFALSISLVAQAPAIAVEPVTTQSLIKDQTAKSNAANLLLDPVPSLSRPESLLQSPAKPIAQTPAAPSREQELLEKLRQLEQKQQQLEQELNALRQQLAPKPNSSIVSIPERRPQQVELSTQVLFLQPRTSNMMDFAILDPGTALAVDGDVARVNYDDVAALRVGLTYRPENTGWEIAASHAFFKTEGQQSAARPATGFLFSTFTHPFQNDSANTADASAKLGYQSTDLEIAYNLNVNRSMGVRLFSGLRFSDVKQEMNVAFNGRDFNQAIARSKNEFTGFGPRMGAQLDLKLASDLKLFGRGAGSLLLGNRSTFYEETDNNGTDLVARFDPGSRQQVVPGLEFSLGLSWQPKIGQRSNFNFSIGYEYQHLFNVSDSIRFVDSASPGVFTQSKNDLSLQGLFFLFGISSQF